MANPEMRTELDFDGESYEEQVQIFWKGNIYKYLENMEFNSIAGVIGELKNGLFRNKDADDFLIDRNGKMQNLCYVDVEVVVPIICNSLEKGERNIIVKVKTQILFRLIIDNENALPEDLLRIEPDFINDSYLGEVKVEII